MGRTCFQPNKTRDIDGQKFGNLTAIRFDHRDNRVKGGNHYWLFRCDCGNLVVVRKNSVTSGNTKRCADCSRKLASKRETTHGCSNTRLYREWSGIIQRCNNPKSTSWERYGAKGISVCDEWLNFENFMKWAMENGYSDELTIDRINNEKGYCPTNCRWATYYEQANNQTTTIQIEYDGCKMPLSYWAKSVGINKHTLYDRIFRYGWSVEKALNMPVRRGK